MLSDYATSWKNKVLASGRAAVRIGPKRGVHGGTPWGTRPENEMRQPQDGGADLDVRSRVAEINSKLNRTGLIEPEDARITGTTRSLMRRLMGLNIIAPKPVKPASSRRSLMVREPARVA